MTHFADLPIFSAAGSMPLPRKARGASSRLLISVGAAVVDVLAILSAVFASGWCYHMLVLGEQPATEPLAQLGLIVSLLVLVPSASRHDYMVGNLLDMRGQVRRMFHLWNMAFVAAIILSFMTKTSSGFSRGTVVLFYASGFAGIVIARHVVSRLVRNASKVGKVQARRIFLVGTEREITSFATRHQPWNLGMEIVGVAIVPTEGATEAALRDASAQARAKGTDDVFVLFPWDQKAVIDAAIEQFMTLPASIHLGAEPLLERFHDVRMSRIGTVASVQLVRRPMSVGDQVVKKIFDLTIGLIAVVLLSPVFLAIAIAIKLDSKGPIFFRQRRYGFNQQPFRIWKFRSMTSMDDGAVVQQATANDARITSVGRVLRKWNLDELPQLFNVLRGEMSLVGPRPHALAHDHEYERRIALYARRHNVKPGITGWAQVNGFRGETSTDSKMRSRVEHDLHYIDNWSILMDLVIMVQTVVSKKAYRNAA